MQGSCRLVGQHKPPCGTELLVSTTPTDGVGASWSSPRGLDSAFSSRQPSWWAPGSPVQAEHRMWPRAKSSTGVLTVGMFSARRRWGAPPPRPRRSLQKNQHGVLFCHLSQMRNQVLRQAMELVSEERVTVEGRPRLLLVLKMPLPHPTHTHVCARPGTLSPPPHAHMHACTVSDVQV